MVPIRRLRRWQYYVRRPPAQAAPWSILAAVEDHGPCVARRHAEARPEGAIEMRDVAEARAEGDVRDLAMRMLRRCQLPAGILQAKLQDPLSETDSGLPQKIVQVSHRDAQL